jgi:predicted membrane-bound spermidine synthase
MRSRAARAYGVLFFLSGATGLVYELLWIRLLYQSFGSTIQSVTTVVAAYMGGLGLGAWLLGRRGDRHPRPAALYGWLEVAIGVFGLLSPFVLALAHRVYVSAAVTLELGGGVSVALRFTLAALVLLVPTTLMGGTLPILTRAFMGTARDRLKPSLGLLYGANTLGAVAGTALAGFFLIEYVGIRASIWATAVVNLGLGGAALVLARALEPVPPVPVPAVADGPVTPGAEPDHTLRRVALALLGVTAFAALLDEIAWTRVLVMIVGGSTYAFTLVLLVFLLGIGLGSALVARRGASASETAADAAVAQGVAAAGAALLFAFFNLLPRYIIAVFQAQSLGAIERLVALGLVVGGVVLVPSIGMGMTFPLLADLVARSGSARGEDVGRAYAMNTVGSIAGAVLTGFVFVVTLGTDLTLRLGLVVSAVAALGLAALAARGVAEGSAEHRRLRVRVLGAGALASAGLVAALAAPRWSTRLIDLGPSIYGREPMDRAAVDAFLAHRGHRQLAYREGWNATVSAWQSGPGRTTLKVNGKADASDHGDMDTQILLALAPVAARPRPASALVIGYGSGVTARVLTDVPGMARVRVLEIEPAVLAMSRFFEHVNDTVLARPGVSVVVDDARSALQIDRAHYDVIVSEPSNIWQAGVATLYTPEFYRIVRRRLADDGVFCQWVQLYQVPVPVVAGVVRNIRTVFPHVEAWFSSPGDVMILGSPKPLAYDRAWLEQLVGPRGALGDLAREYLAVDAPDHYFGHLLLDSLAVARLVERATTVHRDDRPQLEFVAARAFLDPGTTVVFEPLVAIAAAGPAAVHGWPLVFARALTARRGTLTALPYVEAARRQRPDDAFWTIHSAFIRLEAGDTTFADTALARFVPQSADAALLAGLVAAKRGQQDRARGLLTRALRGGADSAEAWAALSALAAQDERWGEAASLARAAFTSGGDTFRRPYPRTWLGEAFTQIVNKGPAPTADSLLADAVRTRPGWAWLHEVRAVAALRVGRCDVAAEEFLLLLEFGIQRVDGEMLMQRCHRGLKF